MSRKLRRDVWRQRTQFAAVVVVVAIGIAVFVAASDAYRNLKDSFATAYSTQRLPDVVLSGPNVDAVAGDAARLPGAPFVTARAQQDLGARIGDHTLLGRVVTLPDGGQPEVGKIALRQGRLPRDGEVLVEQHLSDYFDLKPGGTIELFGPSGWQPVRVSGSGLATEYFWPARSQQEVMTSAAQFGVVFAPASFAKTLAATPQQQLALYAADRRQAAALVSAATGLARDHGLVVQARTDQPSFVALDQDVQTFGQFANLLPLLFLVAAVLGAFILLSRLVAAQRAVIGTLAANGIAPRTLRRHYLGYGLVAGIAAAATGTGRRCAPGPVVHGAVHRRARLAAVGQLAAPGDAARRGGRGCRRHRAGGVGPGAQPRPGRRRPRRCASRRPVPGHGRCSNGSCRPSGTCPPGGGWWCAASAATVVAPASRLSVSPCR